MDRAEGVCVIYQVFGEVGGVAGCSECVFVFLEPCGKAAVSLSHIRFSAVRACQLINF